MLRALIRLAMPAEFYEALAVPWRRLRFPDTFTTSEPHLGELEKAAFLELLSRSIVTLEYGSGGSTLAAVKIVPVVVSVENDLKFARALRRGVRQVNGGRFYPVVVNIGRTESWGEPVDRDPTPMRVRRWRQYPEAPWKLLQRKGLVPDFIFIDGRFRVACTLDSMLRLPAGSKCRFLFDDFQQYGSAYSTVLDFAEEVSEHGRAISFRKSSNFDVTHCRAALLESYSDFR